MDIRIIGYSRIRARRDRPRRALGKAARSSIPKGSPHGLIALGILDWRNPLLSSCKASSLS